MYVSFIYILASLVSFCDLQTTVSHGYVHQDFTRNSLTASPLNHITWDSKKPLRVKDFKGSSKNKPNDAETVSFIGYSLLVDDVKNILNLEISANFDSKLSYFKHTESDWLVLAHEQLHFDITEIHARLFFKKLLETTLYKSHLKEQVRNILQDIDLVLKAKQEQYDAQVHGNPHFQDQWNSWVAEELKELDAYQLKQARIKLN